KCVKGSRLKDTAMHVHDVRQVEQTEMFRRYRWLGLLALGIVLLFLVPWLQRAFWLTPCFAPRPDGVWQCPGRVVFGWIGLRWPLPVEAGLCIGVVLLGAAICCVGEADRIIERIASYIKRRANWLTAFTVVAALLLPMSVAWFVLDRFPNSG